MEKEKLIEEMAKIMFEKAFENYKTSGSIEIDTEVRRHCYFAFLTYCEAIYNRGYRKQEDILHEWVERETAYLNEIAELKKELKKELAEHEEFTKKAKAEIERLASVNMQTIGKNADLQMKVDELKAKQVIECHGMLKGCDIVKQAVKDTAREILTEARKWVKAHYKDKTTDSFGERPLLFIESFGCLFAYLKERYGVEVE